jgi:MFS family permease
MAFAEIRRSRAFLTLCAVQFRFFPSLITVPLHIVIHGIDLGLSKTAAATLLSVAAAASVAGRLTVGTLSDRITGRHAYTICFLPLIAGLSAMALIGTPGPLFAAVAVYGFAHGGFFTVVATTVAEYFGTRAHGAAFGAIVFFGIVGGATGPILAGRFFDTSGSYAPAFTTLAVLAGFGLALVRTLPPAPAAIIRPER